MNTFIPHRYQSQAIEFIREHKRAGLLLDMGLGKTPITLSALSRTPEMLPALIVSPLRCCYNVWPEEIEKFDFPLTYSIVHGNHKLEALHEDADVKITNFETLQWLVDQCKEHKKVPFKTIVIDESSKVKNPFSKRFKYAKMIADHCDYRILLTGTPIPQSYMDLWSQVYLLDSGESLGTHSAYQYKYFELDRWKRPVLRAAVMTREIEAKVHHLMLRGDSGDLLDMPEKIEVPVKVDMDPVQAARYSEVEYGLLSGPDNVHDITESPYTAIRCCASGFLYHTDLENMTRTEEVISEVKLDALQDVVDGIGNKPLLVVFTFTGERKMITDRFKCHYIDGRTTNNEANRLVKQWNAGKLKMLAVHPGAVGFGLNLQAGGRHMVWYSLCDSGELYEQTIGRLWRQGQSGTVFIYKLLMNNTVEEMIESLLKRKILNQQNLLNALRERKQSLTNKICSEGTCCDSK